MGMSNVQEKNVWLFCALGAGSCTLTKSTARLCSEDLILQLIIHSSTIEHRRNADTKASPGLCTKKSGPYVRNIDKETGNKARTPLNRGGGISN